MRPILFLYVNHREKMQLTKKKEKKNSNRILIHCQGQLSAMFLTTKLYVYIYTEAIFMRFLFACKCLTKPMEYSIRGNKFSMHMDVLVCTRQLDEIN